MTRLRLGCIALLCVLACQLGMYERTAADQDQPTLATIMQKYANALGGLKLLTSIATTRTVYTSALLGRTVTVTTTAKAPSSFVQQVNVGDTPLSLDVGFDGKTAWTKTIAGAVNKLSGSRRSDIINQAASLNNSEVVPNRWPTALRRKPDETIDGQHYYVIEVTPRGGSAHDLLIDAQTFLPVMSRQYEGDVKTLDIVRKFGKGPLGEATGAVIFTTRSDGSLPDVTSTLLSTRDNIQVDDAAFAPPVPTNAPTTNT